MISKIFKSVLITSLVLTQIAQGQNAPFRSKPDFETQFYSELVQQSGVTTAGAAVDVSSYVQTAQADKISGGSANIPDGLSSKYIHPACDPHRFEDLVSGKKLSTAQYTNLAKKYFTECSHELTGGTSSLNVMSLLQFVKVRYNFTKHPQISNINIQLDDGTVIPGLLALKRDPQPRPMIVFKCGVFCAADESPATRNYMIHLFDQSPFNVLMLANQTGADYILKNHRITLGGFSEGQEALAVGRWIQEKWILRDRISSVHLMGISLGGNAAVMGAQFNDQYPLPSGRKIFNSVTAICPVVSLRPTFEHLFNSQIAGRVFKDLAEDQFKFVRPYVTDVPDLITDSLFPRKRGDFSDYIGWLAATSLQRRGIATDITHFFKTNNFWNYNSEVKTPMMVWASKDDLIVNNALNAQVVEQNDLYEKSEVVHVLNLDYGNHCAFSSAYGFAISAAVLRNFVLQNSPEFTDYYRQDQEVAWTYGFQELSSRYVHVGQDWTFYPHKEKLKISFKVFDSLGADCMDQSPWNADLSCISSLDYLLPVDQFKNMGARIPKNMAEAQSLIREFNTKVEFRTKQGPLTGTHSGDFVMKWKMRASY